MFFYEASSWEYSLSIPHDVPGLIEKCGGAEKFETRLDIFFRSFIEEHVPPRSVPGAFKGDGGIGKSWFLYLGFSESDFIQPIALFITGQDKAFGTGMFIIATPEILPISGLFQVVLVKILFSQTFGNQGDGIVTIRIFYGAVSGARDAVGGYSRVPDRGLVRHALPLHGGRRGQTVASFSMACRPSS